MDHGTRGGLSLSDRLGVPVSGCGRAQERDGGDRLQGRLRHRPERRHRLHPHGGQALKKLFADRVGGVAQSDIRRMSIECARVKGINLGQGICDQPIEPLIKEAAIQAIRDDRSIYTRLDGIDELRARIAKKVRDYNRIPCDPDGEVIVNVGSTGSFVTACLSFVNPGDEVILFSPFYGYHLHILKICGAALKLVTLRPPDWSYDPKELE